MLKLYGFTASNYHNKVKLALYEKGLDFDEHKVHPRQIGDDLRAMSPLGKVPFLGTAHGAVCESAVILEYLEDAYPEPPLLPKDPWARAKVREIATFMDLHVELVARELYGRAFFGGEISDSHAARVRKLLDRNIPAFRRLARFAPYVAGETFTLADCSAWASLPVVSMATRAIFGEDLLVAHDIDWKAYLKVVGERPGAQRVVAERKADEAAAKARG